VNLSLSLIPGDPKKKGHNLQLQSNVTRSKINIFERFKNQRNCAVRDFVDVNGALFFGSLGMTVTVNVFSFIFYYFREICLVFLSLTFVMNHVSI